MGLISVASVQDITDKIARRFFYLRNAAVSGAADVSYDSYYSLAHVSVPPSGDPLIELYTLSPADSSDAAWKPTTAETIADSLVTATSSAYAIIGGITTHLSRAGVTGGWSQYLTDSDLRVNEQFRRVFSKVGGSGLRVKNVFYDGDEFSFGGFENVSGTATFTKGDDFIDGSSYNADASATGTSWAPTQLRVKVITTIGGTDLDLKVKAKKSDNTYADPWPTVTITAGTTAGTYVDIGSSSDVFVSVDDVDFADGGDEGTNGDTVAIVNKVERALVV